MHVIATAGHVDHGKSSLVRALTGTDPDRLDEERRRGLTIELGYAWVTLPGAAEPVAFVDVPGHERFVPTMLAGVGPVPAALLVVAADDPWMPQAEEHLRALDALGVRHGMVAVTRADLAHPAPMIAKVEERLAGTSLGGSPVVAVSARTGAGLDALRAGLGELTAALPAPDPTADVRMWVDRVFTIAGAGTVVTGTLPAGTIGVGDRLQVGAGDGWVRVRSMQSLGRDVEQASGTARVALRLGARGGDGLVRGAALCTPDAWWPSTVFDVRLQGPDRPPRAPILHAGADAVACRLRVLEDSWARVTVQAPLPLRIGDRALLRDPGTRTVWGLQVADPAAPPLARRGDAAARARMLARSRTGSLIDEVGRRGPVRSEQLSRLGVPRPVGELDRLARVGDWLLTSEQLTSIADRLALLVSEHCRRQPLDAGPPLPAVARQLGLPDVRLVEAAVRPPLAVRDGRVVVRGADGPADSLPAGVDRAVSELIAVLDAQSPFAAPDAQRLAEVGLDDRALAAAHRAGLLLRLSGRVVLLPGADRLAVDRLTALPQPFSTSQARQALGTSRRVVLPLLELLDKQGYTLRLPDDRRRVRG